jgi:hypothetical protein
MAMHSGWLTHWLMAKGTHSDLPMPMRMRLPTATHWPMHLRLPMRWLMR